MKAEKLHYRRKNELDGQFELQNYNTMMSGVHELIFHNQEQKMLCFFQSQNTANLTTTTKVVLP